MKKILLVEDSKHFQLLVARILGKQYDVMPVSNRAEALEALSSNTYDLVLLDIMLPDSDGFELCAQLRGDEKTAELPIVFLTSKKEPTDKVTGFSLGADDYIVKPFEPLEFRARIEARLSKSRDKKQGPEILCSGDIKVNISAQKALIVEEGGPEVELTLTPIEFRLLCYFLKNEERVIDRPELMKTIWGDNSSLQGRTIDRHLSSLRQKLGERANYIQTVSRLGYRFSVTTLARRVPKAA